MKKLKSTLIKHIDTQIYRIVFVLFSIIISLLVYLIIEANKLAHNYPSQISAINEVINETTTAHLWFEEVVSGDTNENIITVFNDLESAKKYIKALIKQENKQVKAIEDKNDLELILQIQKKLNQFYKITKVRYNNRTSSTSGTKIDQEYDALFKDMIGDLKQLKESVLIKFQSEKENFSIIQYLVVFCEIISFSLISFVIFSYTKNKDNLLQKDKLLIRQSKMAVMGEMIENIAHQWRQPLSFISTQASIIQVQKESGILAEDKLVENMESILSNVNYLSQTIEDFRDFYKLNKNKEQFTINDSFEDIFKIVRFDKKHNNIEYIKKDFEHLELNTYKNEFLQVLINIINNAKDQLTSGKNIDLEQKIVYIGAKKEKNKNIITIHDNGGGIDNSILNNIFEAYFTTKDEGVGTGIGLYMSNDIVKNRIEGKLSVENEKLVYQNNSYIGAKFTIVIPSKRSSIDTTS